MEDGANGYFKGFIYNLKLYNVADVSGYVSVGSDCPTACQFACLPTGCIADCASS